MVHYRPTTGVEMVDEDETGFPGWVDRPDGGAVRSPRRGAWAVVVVLLVIAGLLVVGIRAVVPHGGGHDAAGPGPAAAPRATAAQAPTSSAPASSTVPGSGEREVAATALALGGQPLGQLTVSVGTPVVGRPPGRVVNFDSCAADPATVEYLPVEIRPAPGLDATVTVRSGAPAQGTGRLGFFVESSNGDQVPCAAGAHWPTTDTFEAVNGKALVTGYVVLDQAVTAATPQGRPDVLGALQLQLSRFRELDGYGHWQSVTPAAPSVGAFCPGVRTAVCASLG